MSSVFVIDQQKRPLDPVHPGRARRLLSEGKAAVYRRFPFCIILKEARPDVAVRPLRLKLNPGSRTTGLAVCDDVSGHVVFAAEIEHRRANITKTMRNRQHVRQGRRGRHTRYRQARFRNRKRPKGWLPPSMRSRVQNNMTWVRRLQRWCRLEAISLELVHFDMQALQNPEIEGVQYQHSTLQGYEVREYVLEKWQRRCAYCGKENVPLQVEHILARANGGSDRISNLTLACEACNTAKGTQDIRAFLVSQPEVLARLLAQSQAPLKDAAAVNTTRWMLYEYLKSLGLPVEVGSGGRTKYNRVQRRIPKTHWLDAVCVGASTPSIVQWQTVRPLRIQAKGRQSRQMCNVDEHGFPPGKAKGASVSHGFCTGDLVRAVVTKGKPIGVYVGRVGIKSDGYFKISTNAGIVEGIHTRYCRPLHRNDGYAYKKGEAGLPLQA